MTRVSDLLELHVPGIPVIDWDSTLHDFAQEYAYDDIYNRYSRTDLTLFGLGPCSRRDVVIARSRSCYGHDVVTHLNFCRGRLCAVHQFFHSVTDMDARDYYHALEKIRRQLVGSLGPCSLQSRIQQPSQVSFRWGGRDMHAELRSSIGTRRDLSLAVNNPDICSWCMYWR